MLYIFLYTLSIIMACPNCWLVSFQSDYSSLLITVRQSCRIKHPFLILQDSLIYKTRLYCFTSNLFLEIRVLRVTIPLLPSRIFEHIQPWFYPLCLNKNNPRKILECSSVEHCAKVWKVLGLSLCNSYRCTHTHTHEGAMGQSWNQ